jgi:hypothetical protein
MTIHSITIQNQIQVWPNNKLKTDLHTDWSEYNPALGSEVLMVVKLSILYQPALQASKPSENYCKAR